MNDPYLTNLAEQISRGSHKAFDEVFRQYYGRVSNFIRSLIKSQSVADTNRLIALQAARYAMAKPFEVTDMSGY